MKTIEQKLNGLIPHEFGGEMNPELLEGCVNIVDQHAIDFAEWCVLWRIKIIKPYIKLVRYSYGGMPQEYSMAEILAIYKKQPE